MIRTFALVLAFALLLGVPVADSAAQPVELADAGIVFGDCDTPDFQYSLTVPTVESGLPIGSDGAVPAGQSFSLVPVSLEALTSGVAAIVLLDEIDLLACGPIGGVPSSDGSLTIGLAPVDGSGVAGVAYLLPDDDSVVVSLFTIDLGDPGLTTTVPDEISTIASDTGPIDSEDTGSGVFSAAELAYANELIQIMDTMTTSLDNTTRLFDNPRPDDAEWNFDLLLEIVTWQDLQGQVNELTPPPAFADVHQLTVDAFALYVSAGDDVLAGLEANDAATLQSAVTKLDLANGLIRDATDLVNELIDARSE